MRTLSTSGTGTPHLTIRPLRAISIRGRASLATPDKLGCFRMTAKRVFPFLLPQPVASSLVAVALSVVISSFAHAVPAADGACAPYTAGLAALDVRKLPEAAFQFQRAVKDSCQVSDARRQLAELAWRQKRADEGERLFRSAVAYDKAHGVPEKASDFVSIALMLLRMNRAQDAASALQHADVLDGPGWPATYGHVRLCLFNSEWEGAMNLLARFPKGPQGPAAMGEYFYAISQYHVGTGELAQAEGEALRALSADPTDPERLGLFNRVCKERGTTATAITALEQSKTEPGKTAPAALLNELGRMYQSGRKFKEARDMYVAAVAADSNYAAAVLDLGDLMRLAKQPSVAVQLYMRYLKAVPKDVEAMLHITQACLDIGQADQAATTAAEAMKTNPTRPDVRRNFVRAALRSSDPAMGKAAATVFGGMSNDPTWKAEDWLLLAEYHRQLADLDAAKTATAKASEFDPTAAPIEFERGLIEMSAGNLAQAVTHMQAAVTASPSTARYHLNLGIALMKADRKADGLGSIRAAIVADPQYTVGRMALAQALAGVDSVKAANDQYQAILAYDATNKAAMCELGWNAVRVSNCAEARKWFQAVVDADPKYADGWAGMGFAEHCAANASASKAAFEKGRLIDPQNANVKRGFDLLAKTSGSSAP